jgi:oligopeptide/dipeptide ABC transporter ATP-binding protein
MTDEVLRITDLAIGFDRGDGSVARVVDGVSLDIGHGEILGLVGESGSGKSMIALSTLGLVPHPGRVLAGSIKVRGKEIVGAPEKRLRQIRGKDIGMIFQDPMTGLNPVRTIGSILTESVRRHRSVPPSQAMDIAEAALRSVGIPAPRERLTVYPHQLSGGLRQRVMIALALINDPAAIVADEPTTALDATIQAQILELFRQKVLADTGAGGILITHDLGVAAEVCDRIAVIYHGRIVETGATAEVLAAPQHPYTEGLLAAAPRFDRDRPRLTPIPGLPPGPSADRTACSFRPRCRYASEACAQAPALERTGPGRRVACWHPVDRVLEVAE